MCKIYVDDIVRTVKRNPEEQYEYANSIVKNLQYSRERTDGNGSMAFEDHWRLEH